MVPGSSTRRRAVRAGIATLAAIVGACSSGNGSTAGTPPADRPSSPAKVQIVRPTNGEVIHGSTVEVKVKLMNATIVPTTTTNIVPDRGHLHLYLDDQLESMNFTTSSTIGDVTPGLHTLKVEFVASDHLPFDPRVIAQVAFQAKA